MEVYGFVLGYTGLIKKEYIKLDESMVSAF
jgi:6-phosphofructokinase